MTSTTLLILLSLNVLLFLHKKTDLPHVDQIVPPPPTNRPTISKRWIGVQPIKDDKVIGGYGPWPVLCAGPQQMQPVRYCFKDDRSKMNLQPILDKAIVKWAHAMTVSTVTIVPDNAETLSCSDPKIRDDALVIVDGTKDGNDEYNWNECSTESATTGYDYAGKQRGRHLLTFCHLIPGDDATHDKAVKAMTHELGHVMGLNHEHQRPDRDTYLTFHCENLDGYTKAMADVKIDEHALFDDDMKDDARMRVVCADDAAAGVYLPSALSFLRPQDVRSKPQRRKWKAYQNSQKFDYDSIMIYDSFSGSPAGTNLDDHKKWVLAKKDGSAVVQGGDVDAAKAKVSEGDVKAVARLYPKPGVQEGMGEWNVAMGRRLRVVIRGVEHVVERPRKASR
ncbi:hypothetical protein B0A48_10972 [Cryoendolithus antarcticus]|uniref:Metalloendopeptidase n=1 Tax=Cryoendolithus antarcticus TaxID=1507870 RepID=A0A1V8SZB4_9PEZI|nr:hypothetical protein B0A48_10972 [Cryoendolithus antarcticus]